MTAERDWGIGRERDDALALAVAVASERARQTSQIGQKLQSYVYPTIVIVGLFLFWQIATMIFQLPRYLLPSPLQVGSEIVDKASLLAEHGLVTLAEIVAGFGLSIIVGIPLAVMMTYSRTIERALYPLLVGSQTIPKVALAPLFMVWLGFGLAPKVVMTYMISVFPIIIGAVIGLISIENELLSLARSMGASNWQVFWKIRFPNALPSVFGGLKVAITLAVVGAVVAEFVGADKGLGYLIQVANGHIDTTLLLAAVVIISAIGILLYLIVEQVEFLLAKRRGAAWGR
jgi:NitT/TauT family transport system permease protein